MAGLEKLTEMKAMKSEYEPLNEQLTEVRALVTSMQDLVSRASRMCGLAVKGGGAKQKKQTPAVEGEG
eukprot:10550097-Alexandrium_andersonii.AAC.1